MHIIHCDRNICISSVVSFLQNKRLIFQQLVLNDKCPIKYVTYSQYSGDTDNKEAVAINGEPKLDTEQTELQIEERRDSEQTTHFTRFVRKPVSNSVVDSTSNSDSGDTEGADDSECNSSSDSDEYTE